MISASQFASLLKSELVDVNIAEYETLIAETDRSQVTDPLWRGLFKLYDSASEEGRRALLGVMRLVAIDTVSNVLGIIDGSSTLPGFDGDLSLKPRDSAGVELAGDLQTYFLTIIENER